MPELPDITVYIEALESRIVDQTLERTRIPKPFLLRSVDPPISAAQGKRVVGLRRMGKRIVVELKDDLFLVIHLMIAGRAGALCGSDQRASLPKRTPLTDPNRDANRHTRRRKTRSCPR